MVFQSDADVAFVSVVSRRVDFNLGDFSINEVSISIWSVTRQWVRSSEGESAARINEI